MSRDSGTGKGDVAMLTIRGNKQGRFCDGLSRRDFMTIGGLTLGGLTLPQLLATEARAGVKGNHKAVIMVFLPGGPSHQDMFDMKPDAPADIRGEFKPIKTNVSGIEICEHMPLLAKMMDKFTIIRSMTGTRDEHDSHICMSGYSAFETSQNKAPCMGSVLSRLEGPLDKTVPPFVALQGKAGHAPWADPGDTGFLGVGHSPLRPAGPMMTDMTLGGLSLDRLAHRKQLLTSLDAYRRNVDSLTGLDSLSEQAFNILTSSKLVTALDVTKEDPKVRAMYGTGRLEPVDDGQVAGGQGGIDYTWTVAGLGIKNSKDVNAKVNYDLQQDGVYTVTVKSVVRTTGCECSKTKQVVMDRASVQATDITTLQVYPNPTIDLLWVRIPSGMRATEYCIRNAMGALVAQGAVREQTLISVDLPQLSAGLYTLELLGDQGKNEAKFVVADHR